VIGVAELARRFNLVTRSEARVTREHVLAQLGPRGPLESTDQRVLDVAARVMHLIAEEKLPKKQPGFTRYFETMPKILFLYGRGYGVDDIAAEMPFLCSGYGVEVVLGVVAAAIAKRIGENAPASNGSFFPRT